LVHTDQSRRLLLPHCHQRLRTSYAIRAIEGPMVNAAIGNIPPGRRMKPIRYAVSRRLT
jgi:hypothetical protein